VASASRPRAARSSSRTTTVRSASSRSSRARFPTGWAHRGRNVLEIHEAPAFAARCAAHGAAVARAFLAARGLAAADVDLLIASQYPPRFADDVARDLGVPAARVPRVDRPLRSSHTAGPIAALDAAIADGRFARARHVLFVTAGAGIAIGVALYRGAAAEAS
jgi:3-oxoacyl-[acyl-carrier-protein] synthase III